MKTALAIVALLTASPAFAAATEPPELSLQEASALKCSAAFALVTVAQAHGGGKAWPALGTRGREFFVRTSAGIMDSRGWSRDLVAVKMADEAKALQAPGALAAAMGPCLLLLDASGL